MAGWNTPNRKVIVYLDPFASWGRFWFMEFVKPIFDAGGLDYQVVEPDHISDIILKVRDTVWNAKKQHKNEMEAEKRKLAKASRSWFSWPSNETIAQEQADLEQRLNNQFLPHIYKPIYNPAIGLVAVGPNAWRHLLLGLDEGCLTNEETEKESRQVRDAQNLIDSSIPLPPLGFINTKINSGYLNLPIRIFGWFTRRFMAEIATKDALAIVLGNTTPMSQRNVTLGNKDLIVNERKREKELKPEDIVQETWTLDAEGKTGVEPMVLERLNIFSK